MSSSRLGTVGLPVLGVIVMIGAWWGTVAIFDTPVFLVPAPPDVVEAFLRLPEYMLEQTWLTLVETLVGVALSVVAGVLIGLAIASSRVLEQMFYPLLVGLNAVPKLAIAPLLVVWMGFGLQPKVMMVLLLCFFPIVISTAFGLTSTPTELVEYARSLDTPRWRIFAKVRFPYALPQMFVGLKVAITLAVIGAVIGEFVGGDGGLGFVIQSAGATGDTPLAFAAIGLLAAIGVVLFYIIVGLERMLLPWAREVVSVR